RGEAEPRALRDGTLVVRGAPGVRVRQGRDPSADGSDDDAVRLGPGGERGARRGHGALDRPEPAGQPAAERHERLDLLIGEREPRAQPCVEVRLELDVVRDVLQRARGRRRDARLGEPGEALEPVVRELERSEERRVGKERGTSWTQYE